MGRHFTQQMTKGFTIIETMLVLAITGLLVAGMLAGLGSSIGVQRYKDSVATLKSQLQAEYSQIDNVTNGRDASWTCGLTATPAQGGSGGKQPGQTDCVLLGRYTAIVGSEMTTASVIGYENSTALGVNDVATIKSNYTLGISDDTITQSLLEWGSAIAWPVSGPDAKPAGTSRSIAILMLRSPNSGTSYTFTSDTVTDISSVSSTTLQNMMVVGPTVPGQKRQTICIDPNGIIVPEKIAIYINEAANGPSSIESRTNATTDALEVDQATTLRSKC